jgi:hypothetical protein
LLRHDAARRTIFAADFRCRAHATAALIFAPPLMLPPPPRFLRFRCRRFCRRGLHAAALRRRRRAVADFAFQLFTLPRRFRHYAPCALPP